MLRYLPTTMSAEVEAAWERTLGWERNGEDAPWEPVREI
jgi:hypothetical protein